MTITGGTSQACAVCKFQRRKCHKECPLAPYFPADQPKMFQNAHRLFGVSNITKILKQAPPDLKQEAMQSVIFESNMRAQYPVHGCCWYIRRLLCQMHQMTEQLQQLHAQVAMIRDQISASASPSHYPPPPPAELQLGNVGADAIPTQQSFPDIFGENTKQSIISQQPYNHEPQNANHFTAVQPNPATLPELLMNYGCGSVQLRGRAVRHDHHR
ncbi:LOB domain-containing protein 27-like [Rhodamnia argentea]|uniref:LOB domain-containing protein 27-like n=1 Tax=Rhodamnia argentea TaxID=178133 RepID=A0A8B8N6T2_9MYRT|nr:LOB domain-containing protein 27-like [Rhodamnia argentea]